MPSGKPMKSSQIIKIHEYLKGVLFKKEGSVYYGYRDGLTDQMVADKFGVGKIAIERIRADNFGAIGPNVGTAIKDTVMAVDEIKMRLQVCEGSDSALRGQIGVLLMQLNEVTMKYNKLAESLSLNQIIDVRHLMIKKDGE